MVRVTSPKWICEHYFTDIDKEADTQREESFQCRTDRIAHYLRVNDLHQRVDSDFERVET